MSELITKRADILQGIITRMAQNSFTIKGWAVTVIAALLAFSNKDTERYFAILAAYPTVAFWGLDAYYLMKERQVRDINVQGAAPGKELDITVPDGSLLKYLCALFAWAVWPLYAMSLIITWLLVCH